MTIQGRIRLFAGIFFLSTALVIFGYALVIQPIRASFQKLVFSVEYQADVYMLSVLRHEYLDHDSNRAAIQWKILADQSIQRLNQVQDWSPSELIIIQRMKQTQADLYSIIQRIAMRGPMELHGSTEYVNTMYQVDVLHERLMDNVRALSHTAIEQMSISVRLHTPIFFGLILLLVLVGIILLLILERTVITPISVLEVYAGSINGSNQQLQLDSQLLRRKDELGTLARTLEAMYRKMQGTHVELEKRVLERTKELDAVRIEAEAHANTAERLNRLTIGRELKMLELKKEIQRLKDELEQKK